MPNKKPSRGSGSGPLPALFWVVLGGVAAAAIISLGVAIYMQLPPKSTAVQSKPAPMLALDLPMLPGYLMPTEVPPEALISPSQTVSPLALVLLPVSPTKVSPTAAPVRPYPKGAGQIALVMDDVGMDAVHSARLLNIAPPAVTLAFMVEGQATQTLAAQAQAAGHSLILHLPMEPLPHPSATTPPLGPYGLRVGMDSATIAGLVVQNLALLPQAEGVNNHMGSHFTQWEAGMQVVLSELNARGLYFLDSRTAAPTATQGAAAGLPIGLAMREVFLDHNPTVEAVRAQLHIAVKLAQTRAKKGNTLPVVVIGHPLPATLEVLAADLAEVQAAGIVLVPLRAAVR